MLLLDALSDSASTFEPARPTATDILGRPCIFPSTALVVRRKRRHLAAPTLTTEIVIRVAPESSLGRALALLPSLSKPEPLPSVSRHESKPVLSPSLSPSPPSPAVRSSHGYCPVQNADY